MAKATFSILSEKDKQLVLETEPKKLAKLSEDELLDLHSRVRRARTRNLKNYRRSASQRVSDTKRRAGASKAQSRDRARAEVLEEALARVSRRLGAVAHAAAEELKAERLAAARKGKGAPGRSKAPATKSAGKPKGTAKAKKSQRSPASEKARASTKSTGKRRQAKRDGR
jgi:hypothetical protein